MDNENERAMCFVKTTRNLGDPSGNRVHIEPHVSGIQCGETPNIQKRNNTIPDPCKNNFKCEHTFHVGVAMLQLRKIAMVYRLEFVASPVIKTSLAT